MDDASARHYDQFIRARDFANANASDVAATDAASRTTKLDLAITGLTGAKAGQPHGSAAPRGVLIAALLHDVQDINRTADAIGQEVLGFEQFFPVPRQRNPAAILTGTDTIIGNLVAAAGDDAGTVAAKADRVTRFVAHGLAATFATDLVAHRAQIDAAKTTEDNADSVGEQNTAAIGRLVTAGAMECHYLDAIFRNVYRNNADKLAAWTMANHLERAPHKKQTPAPTPPPPNP